ncbi:MAG: Carboxymuconolactone decarboxylase [Tardiphaga sp.]|jgi:4-carboxymuconolactone decarboxylase|nr:Carboxymuconolactone decarboxylase [Tardiphaga sp.]
MSTHKDNPTTALLALGRKTFEGAMGVSPDGFIQSLEPIAAGYGQLIVEMEFGAAYNRPGLDLKTRELIIIASCGALGAAGIGAVEMHIPAALRAGATRLEITEALVQIGFAAGLPTSLGALQAAAEIFSELDATAA